MRYALLIYRYGERYGERCGEPRSDDASRSDARELPDAVGAPSVSHALADPTTATTVRLRGDRLLLADGPVADHHEQLRGVVVIEARDLDEAIAVAARTPDARQGAVEIRPVRVPL